MRQLFCLTGTAFLLTAGTVHAAYNVTQGASAPTYGGTSLTFDEVGGPTGSVGADGWLASHGIASMVSGTGNIFIGDNDAEVGEDLDGLSARGPFGVFMEFNHDITEMSFQGWDNSGPGGPFGGGAAVVLLNDGVEVLFHFITNPAWGGEGDEWFDITATGGEVFDEVRFLGFGFSPVSVVDNFSWNAAAVPAPGALALLALAGLIRGRRRLS